MRLHCAAVSIIIFFSFFLFQIPAFSAPNTAQNQTISANTEETSIKELKDARDEMVSKQGPVLFLIIFCGLAFGFWSGILVTLRKSLSPVSLIILTSIATLLSLLIFYVYSIANISSNIKNISYPFILLIIYHFLLRYASTDIQESPLTPMRQIGVTVLSIFFAFVGAYICNKVALLISFKYFAPALSAAFFFILPLIGFAIALQILYRASPLAEIVTAWLIIHVAMSVIFEFTDNIILLSTTTFLSICVAAYFAIPNPETEERMSIQEVLSFSGISTGLVSIALFLFWGITHWLGYSSAVFYFAIS